MIILRHLNIQLLFFPLQLHLCSANWDQWNKVKTKHQHINTEHQMFNSSGISYFIHDEVTEVNKHIPQRGKKDTGWMNLVRPPKPS